jgi:hypothetical protein
MEMNGPLQTIGKHSIVSFFGVFGLFFNWHVFLEYLFGGYLHLLFFLGMLLAKRLEYAKMTFLYKWRSGLFMLTEGRNASRSFQTTTVFQINFFHHPNNNLFLFK